MVDGSEPKTRRISFDAGAALAQDIALALRIAAGIVARLPEIDMMDFDGGLPKSLRNLQCVLAELRSWQSGPQVPDSIPVVLDELNRARRTVGAVAMLAALMPLPFPTAQDARL